MSNSPTGFINVSVELKSSITYTESKSPELDKTESNIIPVSNSGDFDSLVISGSSIRGFLLLGAIQYAIDSNLLHKINTYVGTSAGAMICYLLAIGYTPIEIIVYICTKQVIEKFKYFNIVGMTRGEGAISFSFIHEHLERITIEKIGRLITLKELYTIFGKKLICNTYNRTSKKEEIISCDSFPDMPCLVALRMTSNLPFLFEDFKYLGSKYIDGGVSDNFPIHIADKTGKKILGIALYSSDIFSGKENNDESVVKDIYEILSIPMNQIVLNNIKNVSDKCTVVLIDPKKFGSFDFSIDNRSKLDMFSCGYTQTKEYFEAKK